MVQTMYEQMIAEEKSKSTLLTLFEKKKAEPRVKRVK